MFCTAYRKVCLSGWGIRQRKPQITNNKGLLREKTEGRDSPLVFVKYNNLLMMNTPKYDIINLWLIINKIRNGVVMKTLILNGSPRINGDTSSIIKKFTEKKIDEYKIVDAYRCNISACLDCRNCWKNNGCSINYEMQEIYKYIQECDNIYLLQNLRKEQLY